MKLINLIILLSLIVFTKTQVFSSFSSTLTRINNPERGWYNWQGTGDVENKHNPLQSWIKDGPETIIFRIFHMRSFRNKALSSAQLASIRADFKTVQDAKKKIIPKFCYGEAEPDAPLNIVLGHINQLKPIFNEFKQIILTVQAGFIGYWGEWHSSSNNLLASKSKIMSALLAAIPAPIQVSIRYPYYKTEIAGNTALTESLALADRTSSARIGFHNDCFLASEDDRGTYNSPAGIAANKKIVATDSKFVINGGETCEPFYAPRSNCAVARTELKSLHFTYLNNKFSGVVLNNFKSGGCYEEITDNLGYRLVISESRISSTSFNINGNSGLTFSFKITNRGYAAPVSNRPFQIAFIHSSKTYYLNLSKYNTAINLRKWYHEAGTFTVSGTLSKTQIQTELTAQGLSLNSLSGKTYPLYIRLPDKSSVLSDPKYCIGFVNSGVFNTANGLNDIKLSLRFTTSNVLEEEETLFDEN